jgi:predicted Zn-dependent protease
MEQGVFLVDMEKAFTYKLLAPSTAPESPLFTDHVHFTFDGDYLAAVTLFPAVREALNLAPNTKALLTRDQCAEALAFTNWDALNVAAAMVEMTSKPPFLDQLDHDQRERRSRQLIRDQTSRLRRSDLQRAVRIYQAALARTPGDWQLQQNYGSLLLQFGQPEAAADQFKAVLQRFPDRAPLRVTCGDALIAAGRWDDAQAEFEAALRIDPGFFLARQALQRLAEERARPRQAATP